MVVFLQHKYIDNIVIYVATRVLLNQKYINNFCISLSVDHSHLNIVFNVKLRWWATTQSRGRIFFIKEQNIFNIMWFFPHDIFIVDYDFVLIHILSTEIFFNHQTFYSITKFSIESCHTVGLNNDHLSWYL